MNFFADIQTLNDLNITGRFKNNSVARLFDEVITSGGRKLMEQMFQEPLLNPDDINKRSGIFRYFARQGTLLPFAGEELEIMENYLSSVGSNNLISTVVNVISKKVLEIATQDNDYAMLESDISKTIDILNRFRDFVEKLDHEVSPFSDQLNSIRNQLSQQKLKWIGQERGNAKFPLVKLIRYDYYLRTELREAMTSLMDVIFQLDVYIAVAGIAVKKDFRFARAQPKSNNKLTITGLYHPTVENAVKNTVSLHQESNVLFLTGANMAGKSTLMKSLGINIYLAHMGFPVAAEDMEFSVKDGLYSSINVPDNLSMGYSHFYAEVLRVKTVAEKVAEDKSLVVIFDELFKGTNVKDAYEATFEITKAFSENRDSFFVISTHIIEVGEELRRHCENFNFSYLPTTMIGSTMSYTYKLKEGITADRHGMMIIENEKILDIIRHDETQE
ncbi:DNA mismatch repair protein [Mucilaginibacter sp. SG564]|uniref:MutS-related protein n=1 Tax=Mucilaginibacter sp. SG564 TaxID=2587022 RepID=UPI00155767EC|nr:DNA mismatch repair protein [Mucilaginibacter sp. SG564]NOW95066.1 DNA mismatch repair ATPase MutS [Mucilaginibacter sp. SG564]